MMIPLDDDLLTALRAARPDPGYQPSATVPEARAMQARIVRARHGAADVMVVRDAPERQHVKRASSWLFPLAAAASIAGIALGAVIVAHPASHTATQGGPATTAQAAPPEFYMTTTDQHALQLQVRRTADGAVTATTTIPAATAWGNNITAAASDRAFFFGYYPYPCSTSVAITTFYRVTITGSGRISGIAAVGHVQGMLDALAVSPDGSQMAYSALPGQCRTGPGSTTIPASVIGILNLSTGTVRTWQNTNTTGRNTFAWGLSWAPDGRTLIIDSSVPGGTYLTVTGLDTTSSGGSLQAHSTTLLQQNQDCFNSTTCVAEVIAGPHDSMTAREFQTVGHQARVLIVSIPLTAGRPQTVLYSGELGPTAKVVGNAGLTADPSGQWLLLWPNPQHASGWISGGQVHPLPGVGQSSPQGIAW
jgi:hypothetical protein